jgi:hypothetical protein
VHFAGLQVAILLRSTSSCLTCPWVGILLSLG